MNDRIDSTTYDQRMFSVAVYDIRLSMSQSPIRQKYKLKSATSLCPSVHILFNSNKIFVLYGVLMEHWTITN